MIRYRLGLRLLIAALLVVLTPSVALAQEPIDPPAGFAEVRARFENLTPEQVAARGYRPAPPMCISSPAGGMGVHAQNNALWQRQFNSARLDPQNPPMLLLSADMKRVVGLEWEAKNLGQREMRLFGQRVPLLPGHPGVPEPHFMLHAYFRPNGKVLFAEFDPQLSCQLPATATETIPNRSDQLPALPITVLAIAFTASLGWTLRRRGRA